MSCADDLEVGGGCPGTATIATLGAGTYGHKSSSPEGTGGVSDFVNRQPEFTITNAELVSYADGHTVTLDEVSLVRDDLFAIEAREPRGETARRIHTVRHRLELKIGPYTVLGQLHTMPGSPPLSSIGRRPTMIPPTNATIAYNDVAVWERGWLVP